MLKQLNMRTQGAEKTDPPRLNSSIKVERRNWNDFISSKGSLYTRDLYDRIQRVRT